MFAVKVIGEDCLWMKGVDEIDTFVVRVCTGLQNIGTIKYDITGTWAESHHTQHCAQWYARPLADGAPPLDTIVTRNLRTRRHRTQLIKRQFLRARHQPIDFQSPLTKIIGS